ncbi:MAG TPA: antitoxin family protein [Pirellulales bacterium]|nr:antitoxin family protein [Pirellulales bacterium]
MGFTFEAIYENGVLRPTQPLPFEENERVCVTVESPLDLVRRSFGALEWKGDPKVLEHFALGPIEEL